MVEEDSALLTGGLPGTPGHRPVPKLCGSPGPEGQRRCLCPDVRALTPSRPPARQEVAESWALLTGGRSVSGWRGSVSPTFPHSSRNDSQQPGCRAQWQKATQRAGALALTAVRALAAPLCSVPLKGQGRSHLPADRGLLQAQRALLPGHSSTTSCSKYSARCTEVAQGFPLRILCSPC